MPTAKYLIVVLSGIIFCLGRASFGQGTDTMSNTRYQIGTYASIGASVFKGDVPNGSKSGLHFPAFGFGVMGISSFHSSWGFALGVGYDSRGMWFKQDSGSQPSENITMNYFSIQPSIKFKQFLLGINIGIPLSISYSSEGRSDVHLLINLSLSRIT